MADRTSKIILAKNVKMDRELKNVVNYNTSQMLNMLTTTDHFVSQSNTYSFIRNTGTIQTDFSYSQALQSNYIAFQNYDYSNKWFYAWIEDVIYKGERNTEIKYKVDSFSTFNQDLNYENCFVVREHVNDDTIGLHTLPENIDTGDTVIKDAFDVIEFRNYYIGAEVDAVPVHASSDGGGLLKFTGSTSYNKLVSGHGIIIFKTVDELKYYIHRMNTDNAIELVHNIFIVPTAIFASDNELYGYFADTTIDNKKEVFYWYEPQNKDNIRIITNAIQKNRSFPQNYNTIKNNKCYCYPYNYLLVSNNIGTTNIYKYEDFSDSECNFDVIGCLCVGGSFKLIPKNYKGVSSNYDESMNLAKFPTCGWSSDGYTAWLSQNAANEYAAAGTSIVGGAIEGGASGGGIGALIGAGISAAGEVFGLIDKFDKAKLLPFSGVGSNNGNITWAMGGNNFVFKRMICKPEYMAIADNYFTKYGYKINRVKTPNITGRRYFNYVEVAPSEDACFGSVPEIYIDEIIKAFRKGITIWHDDSKIGDYSVSNTIL